MRVTLVLLLLVSLCGRTSAQVSKGIQFRSVWDDTAFVYQDPDFKYSSCWGWSDTSGHECAVFGSRDYTYFLDVSNPDQPKLVLKEPGKEKDVIWREYRSYKNYVYAINDGAHGSLQIFDMQHFPDSVVKVYDSDALMTSSHMLNITDDRLYLLGSKTLEYPGGVTLGIFYLKDNPANPSVLGYYYTGQAPYVHDAIVRNDTLFAFSGYEGLRIYNVHNIANIHEVNAYTNYPGSGYCHSGAFDPSGKYLYMEDEVPTALPLKVLDISSAKDINFVDTFRSKQGFTAHNPFVKDSLLFVSYYEEGVQVWNIKDPIHPVRVAYYDTYPDDTGSGHQYKGCWNVYPYFPSGNIVAIDRKYGLYTLSMDKHLTGILEHPSLVRAASAYPNPVLDQLVVSIPDKLSAVADCRFIDISGREVYHTEGLIQWGKLALNIPSTIPPGFLMAEIRTQSGIFVAKVVKQ